MTDGEYVIGWDNALGFLSDSIKDGWHDKEGCLDKISEDLDNLNE